MRRRFEGKSLVLAGAGGIGGAAAVRLASEGASVVIGDIRPDVAQGLADGITASGGEAIATTMDLSSSESVEAFVRVAIDAFGRIDGLFNVAADLRPSMIGADTDVLNTPLDVWQHTLEVNLTGYFRTIRAVLPHLLEHGGAIVNTASAAAYGGETTRVAYGVSKAGVAALTRHVANAYGQRGIRCNAIAPGLILTGERSMMPPDSVLPGIWKGAVASSQGLPSPRIGAPEDVAAMAAYLLSDEAAYVNGQSFGVDGGLIFR